MGLFDSTRNRGIIKGELFEIAVLHLLLQNDFSKIQVRANGKELAPERVRETRERFIELKGRGEWHQIDCPCEYDFVSPFMYPIRLIGEVKYHNKPIDKEDIREFIGVLKDVSENYFVPADIGKKNFHMLLPCRYLEVGVFFSAVGFTRSAELLAYAHGIKMISYENNFLINNIKKSIDKFEKSTRYSNYNKHRRDIFRYIDQRLKENSGAFYYDDSFFGSSQNERNLVYKLDCLINEFLYCFSSIKSNFFVTTHEGIMLHFLGDGSFPDGLFINEDEAFCQIHYDNITDEPNELFLYDELDRRARKKKKPSAPKKYAAWYLTINGDEQKTKFYFTPPQMLLEALDLDAEKLLDEKETIFKRLSFRRAINGQQRNLTLKIDKRWLREMRQRIL